jgi:hypothetical protein
VHHVGADAALGVLHHLLDLVQERVDQSGTSGPLEWVMTTVTQRDISGDCLLVHPGQVRCGVSAPRSVERFENLHDFPVRLGQGVPPGRGLGLGALDGIRSQPRPEGFRLLWLFRYFFRRFRVRQAGGLVSTYPDRSVRLSGSCRVRRQMRVPVRNALRTCRDAKLGDLRVAAEARAGRPGGGQAAAGQLVLQVALSARSRHDRYSSETVSVSPGGAQPATWTKPGALCRRGSVRFRVRVRNGARR